MTIVNMAQNFVGSNNVNLLLPIGQFGTRLQGKNMGEIAGQEKVAVLVLTDSLSLQGGKDAASPRYIFTTLSPIARNLFNESDDCLLDYLTDDGLSIEPVGRQRVHDCLMVLSSSHPPTQQWYMPVLPTVLINGSDGIGTGWSSTIPNYNPRDIVSNLMRLMDGEEPVQMVPWYKDFNGTIVEKSSQKYTVGLGVGGRGAVLGH